MEILRKSLPFTEVKAGDDGATFSGYCAAFFNCDGVGDVITPGAFKDTLADFLADGQICFEHCVLIGKPLEAREDAKGLFIKGSISDTSCGRDVKALLKDGVLRKMSIGYRALGRKPTNTDDVKAYWNSVGYKPSAEDLFNLDDNKGYLSFLTAIKLYEASPVGFPANTQADITSVDGKGLLRLSGVKSLVRELREGVKAGRAISKANRDRLKAIHDGIMPAAKDLAALLDETRDAGTEPAGDDDDDDPKAKRAAELKRARAALALLSCDPLLMATA